MTNEPTGNFIVSANIGNNGKMVSIALFNWVARDSLYLQSLVKAVSTGGIGAHGQTSPNGPDPLFSQGSVKASATGNVLATVNVSINL